MNKFQKRWGNFNFKSIFSVVIVTTAITVNMKYQLKSNVKPSAHQLERRRRRRRRNWKLNGNWNSTLRFRVIDRTRGQLVAFIPPLLQLLLLLLLRLFLWFDSISFFLCVSPISSCQVGEDESDVRAIKLWARLTRWELAWWKPLLPLADRRFLILFMNLINDFKKRNATSNRKHFDVAP